MHDHDPIYDALCAFIHEVREPGLSAIRASYPEDLSLLTGLEGFSAQVQRAMLGIAIAIEPPETATLTDAHMQDAFSSVFPDAPDSESEARHMVQVAFDRLGRIRPLRHGERRAYHAVGVEVHEP